MALQATSGLFYPSHYGNLAMPIQTAAAAVIDASGEKFAWWGPVWWNGSKAATKNITKIGFLPGTVVSAGGSQMRMSLQDLSTTTGSPARPDGTQDQTVDFLASALTSNTWYQTAALSANRTVSYGDMLAVVLEFNSFAGSDSVQIVNAAADSGNAWNLRSSTNLFTASWASQAMVPNVVLEFTDGSFGGFFGGFPFSSISSTQNINTGTTPDEVALRFVPPFKCKSDGAWMSVSSGAASRDYNVVLYEGTTAVATGTVDAEQTRNDNQVYVGFFSWPEYTLTAGTTYYVAFKPTTASNCNYRYFDVNANGHFGAHWGGTSTYWGQRTDAGSWTDTTTRRILGGISISALDDGVSSGGSSQRVYGG